MLFDVGVVLPCMGYCTHD